jgi:hypothetical protein
MVIAEAKSIQGQLGLYVQGIEKKLPTILSGMDLVKRVSILNSSPDEQRRLSMYHIIEVFPADGQESVFLPFRGQYSCGRWSLTTRIGKIEAGWYFLYTRIRNAISLDVSHLPRWRTSFVPKLRYQRRDTQISSRESLWSLRNSGIAHVNISVVDKSTLNLDQSLFRDVVSVHRLASGFLCGTILKIGNEAQHYREQGNYSRENNLESSPPNIIGHLRWPIGMLGILLGIVLSSLSIWELCEGRVLKSVVLMLFAASFAGAATVVLCAFV